MTANILEKLRSDPKHPDDIKEVIIDWNIDDWEYDEISIGSIKNLLEDYEIEVTSPDGFVKVEEFIDKGLWEQYVFVSARGDIVRCSNGHRFETSNGWVFAKDFPENGTLLVLHDDGKYYRSTCVKTNSMIPIVDISVDHENHRYYTNGVSSHNTGGGKSLVKCHAAASALMFGKNVLYITMEMAEERIAQRIDANLLDISLDELMEMPRDVYEKRISRLKGKTAGRLVIKEYPTGSAHAGHFRYMINELKMKKNFKPDLICIDYLNICTSSRVKGANAANSYTLIKSVAEEIRGLAMEFDCAVLTSSQYNRSGYDTSDVDLTSTSESMGTAHTADAIFALISSEELESMGQLMIKQLKNRWGDLSYYRRFVVGIDRSKMKLYNLEDSAQGNIQSESNEKKDKPVFDKTTFGEKWDDVPSKRSKKKFELENIQ